MTYQVGEEKYSADDLVRMCAGNPDLFYQIFFPRTVRQASAPFHLGLDHALDDPTFRFVHARMFRGSAKTTRLRMYTARRVAYGLSHTILYVGASEDHASRSVKWLRRQVEVNRALTGVFGLRQGSKWHETELEILNDVTNETCWVLGAGITGNIRGINFDDYRPDLIILDDVLTDENAATPDQRRKVVDLILGALKGSLAPEVEDPNAKMVFLQTPMHGEDASARAKASGQWKTLEIPIWTDETLDVPIEQQESRWPERYPSAAVRADKQAAANDNELSTWIREYECRLVAKEELAFRPEWLQIVDIMPEHTWNVLAVDPAPPPSDQALAKGLVGNDFEAVGVVGHLDGNYYLKEYGVSRGHDPSWTLAKMFELGIRHRIVKVVIEGVAYQRTLKWIFEQEMRRRQIWFPVEVITGDKRRKYHRIVGTLKGVASQQRLFCRRDHTEFIEQFTTFSSERSIPNDDVIDMVAIGLSRLVNPVMEMGADAYSAQLATHGRYKVPQIGRASRHP